MGVPPMTKVTIFFDKSRRAKEYNYDIVWPENPTKENIAYLISEAMVKANHKRKKTSRLNYGRYYNLIFKLLQTQTNITSSGLTINAIENSFREARELNKHEAPQNINGNVKINRWRVGYSFWNHLAIDIDNRDTKNLFEVKTFYENLLMIKFHILKTNGGYWLVSKNIYENKRAWLLDVCKILYPMLTHHDLDDYLIALKRLDTKDHKITGDEFKRIPLYRGHGNFDIPFIFISIKRGMHTLRISKKKKGDKIEMINIDID